MYDEPTFYDREVRTWALWCHLGTLSCYLVPFGNIIAPLIIWLIKKDEMSFVDEHAKESLNFQISMTIYFFVSAILCLILIGFVLLMVLMIAQIVFVIVAAIRANDGKSYRYPFTIRLIG